MKILVLGSSSFSGRSLIRSILDRGDENEVIGVYRKTVLNTPYDAAEMHKQDFQDICLDINTDYLEIANIVRKERVTHVVNFAAMSMVAESWSVPSRWYQTNIWSLAKLVEVLQQEKCNIEKFVHFTTPEVYGTTPGLLRENWDFHPSTPYAISRAAGDWHLRALFNTTGFPVVFTRAANVYGEYQRLYRIVPKTIFSIISGTKLPLQGGGNSVRSFIHIDDVSEALMKILSFGHDGSSYHISTMDFVSISEIVGKICKAMGVHFENAVDMVEDRKGKDFAYKLDSSKLRADFGWSDRVSLDVGILRTIEWVKENLGSFSASDLNYRMKG